MSTLAPTALRPRLSLRPLALPAEHGAWGLLFEPIALGLIVAPSRAGFVFSIAAIAFFLARHPFKLAAQDRMRGRRYPRTRACELLAGAYLLAGSIAIAGAWKLAGAAILIPLLPAAVFASIQFSEDLRSRSRSALAEMCGAAAAACLAASIAIGGGELARVAISLAALMLARSLPSIFYVRTALHGRARRTMLALHLLAVVVAIALWRIDAAPWSATLSMLMLFGRAWPPVEKTPARAVGYREVGWGAVNVLLISIGYRW